MIDELNEFYGDEITEQSIKYQMDFLLNQYVYYNDIKSLEVLHFLADGLLKDKNVEQLYNKALNMFQNESE